MRADNICKAEVLRYLGHNGQELGAGLERLIDETLERCCELSRPRAVWRVFTLEKEAGGPVRLPESGLALSGESAERRLEGAGQCAVLAVTLGIEVEAEIGVLQKTDLTRALVLDAAATAAAEAACDSVQREIEGFAAGKGLSTGERFSPGYGDLPLKLQPDILRMLDAGRKIGLTCTDSMILLPRKSVTAFIGLFTAQQCARRRTGCADCGKRDSCAFRKQEISETGREG